MKNVPQHVRNLFYGRRGFGGSFINLHWTLLAMITGVAPKHCSAVQPLDTPASILKVTEHMEPSEEIPQLLHKSPRVILIPARKFQQGPSGVIHVRGINYNEPKHDLVF